MVNLILSPSDHNLIKSSLLSGFEIATGARARATHYHTRRDQVEAVKLAISKLFDVSRELPLLISAIHGVNAFFIQEALLHEFTHTAQSGRFLIIDQDTWTRERFGDMVIHAAFERLQANGTPYVMRFFQLLKTRKINNARARRFALHWIFKQRNLDFLAVKYRAKLKIALVHLWGRGRALTILNVLSKIAITAQEKALIETHVLAYAPGRTVDELHTLISYIFTGSPPNSSHYDPDDAPTIAAVEKAREDVFHSAARLVPLEVLEGLVANPKHPQHNALWATKEQRDATRKTLREKDATTTATQRVRERKSDQALGVSRETRDEKADPLVLLKAYYEGAQVDLNVVEDLAAERKIVEFPWDKIAIIWDKSFSMTGSAEARNTPRAISHFTGLILRSSARAVLLAETEEGSTDYATPFLYALQYDADAVFVLGDGYENAPFEGAFATLLEFARSRQFDKPVFHIAPLGSAEAGAKVRALGGAISVIASPASLKAQIEIHLLEADPLAWLKMHVEKIGEMK